MLLKNHFPFTGCMKGKCTAKPLSLSYGTVFLDEIGDMPYDMQPKILRVLEEKELERIGGAAPVKSDFRLIAASNQPLEEMVQDGRFRKDLFYRLNVIRFHIAPLRERRGDIIPIAKSLLQGMAENSSFSEIKIHPAAEEILLNYDWPGNVRELVNVLSRITYLLERDTIQPYDIPLFLRQGKETKGGGAPTSFDSLLDAAGKNAVLSALASTGSNKTAAALLGIHRTHLYKKMKKYGI